VTSLLCTLACAGQPYGAADLASGCCELDPAGAPRTAPPSVVTIGPRRNPKPRPRHGLRSGGARRREGQPGQRRAEPGQQGTP
jgi:hypothetical protein